MAKILNSSRQQLKEWGLIQAIGHQPGADESSPHSFLYKVNNQELAIIIQTQT